MQGEPREGESRGGTGPNFHLRRVTGMVALLKRIQEEESEGNGKD